jgi:hypothetical protein
MEPEGSSPNSQELSTCPYSEPYQSSPHYPNPTSPRSILILSTHLRFDLPSDNEPSGSMICWEILGEPLAVSRQGLSSMELTYLGKCILEVEVEVNLRPTVSRPVRLGIGPPYGTLDQILSCSSFFC